MVAEGALAVGCRFFAGYPITPASEIYEAMMHELPARGGAATGLDPKKMPQLQTKWPAAVLQYSARPCPTTPTGRVHLGRSMPLLHNPALHPKCRKPLGADAALASRHSLTVWQGPLCILIRLEKYDDQKASYD